MTPQEEFFETCTKGFSLNGVAAELLLVRNYVLPELNGVLAMPDFDIQIDDDAEARAVLAKHCAWADNYCRST